jgi:N-acyl amino acid synthase FeeM
MQQATATERGIELLDRIDYRLAETPADKDTIYRLRYRAYLNEGAIEPNRDHKITDRFDDMSNAWIFGVYLDGTLASSIRLSISSPEHALCPSVEVFRDYLQTEVDQGKVMVDPTRFVADPELAGRFPELPYLTLRLCFVACSFFNADLGLATVRPEHQPFYKRLFNHQPLSPPRIYPGLIKPICLMAVDFPASREKVFARYPYLRSSFFERRMLFERRGELAGSLTGSSLSFARASIVPRS